MGLPQRFIRTPGDEPRQEENIILSRYSTGTLNPSSAGPTTDTSYEAGKEHYTIAIVKRSSFNLSIMNIESAVRASLVVSTIRSLLDGGLACFLLFFLVWPLLSSTMLSMHGYARRMVLIWVLQLF
jgi:hypothetical protein